MVVIITFEVSPNTYRDIILDDNSFSQLFKNVKSTDPLSFKAHKEYKDQIISAVKKTGHNDAIACYSGKLNDRNIILSIMNFSFIGGSMGSVVGECVFRSIEYADKHKIPFILICSSGGARMQESALALMQLAKTVQDWPSLKAMEGFIFHYLLIQLREA